VDALILLDPNRLWPVLLHLIIAVLAERVKGEERKKIELFS
jgi:hypothetical protein